MSKRHFALIGHPVGHTMSPAIHQVVYEHYGLECDYAVIDCCDEAAVLRQIERVRSGELTGLNVTVPWKRLALDLADRSESSAKEIGAANVLSLDSSGCVVADNTDASALANRIVAGCGRTGASPGSAVVLGNGGAALAAVVACRLAGAERVAVSARGWREGVSQWPRVEQFLRLKAEPLRWVETGASSEQNTLASRMNRASVIVQATSAGMLGVGGGELLSQVVSWNSLRPDVYLYDVVYNPPSTPFLECARAHGYAYEGGLTMLVGQAALAIQRWLGVDAPKDKMRLAAEQLLYGGGA